jgi:hypothetical protein
MVVVICFFESAAVMGAVRYRNGVKMRVYQRGVVVIRTVRVNVLERGQQECQQQP